MISITIKSGAQSTTKRIALASMLALGTALVVISPASAQFGAGQPPAPGQSEQQPGGSGEQGQNEVQQILAKYGQFSKHEKYGDVWKPTQVAQGWRPYEPCHWTYNTEMKSWYFDDKTEWGAIVHHYGRWTLDAQQGWLWVPGSEFGPGWVSWNMRGGEVGWAPLPPEQDASLIQTAAFQNDPNLWIYVASDQLGKGCGAGAPPPPQPPRAMAPAMQPPAMPMAPQPAVYGGGGYGGGYIPPRIVINRGCHHHSRWCHWSPHWNPRPHPRPFPHPRPGPVNCFGGPMKCNPTPKPKPGPDQKCGIFGQFCKGQQANHGHRPGCRAISPTCTPDLFKNGKRIPHHFGQRHHFQSRFANHHTKFNNRFASHQPRFNNRQLRSAQPRNFAPRHTFAARNFAPRSMGGGARMGGGSRMGGGMRFAGGGRRR